MTDPTPENAERLATLTGELAANLPEGIGFVVFLIAPLPTGDFESVVASSIPPADFAPVLVEWLERYARGDATPG